MKNLSLIFLFLLFARSAKTQSVEYNLPTLFESQLETIVPMPDSNYLTTLYESQQTLSVCKFSKKGTLLWRKKITNQYSSEPIRLMDAYFDEAKGQIYLLFWIFNCDIHSARVCRIDIQGGNLVLLNSDSTTLSYPFKQALLKTAYIAAMPQQGKKDTFFLPQYANGMTQINLVKGSTNKKINTLATLQGDYSSDICALSSDKVILYSKSAKKLQVFDSQWNSIEEYSFPNTQLSHREGRVLRQYHNKVWIFCKDKDKKSNPTLYEMSWDTLANKLSVLPHLLSTGGGMLNYEDVLMEEKTTWTVGTSLNFENGQYQKAFLKTVPTQTLLPTFQANDVSVSDVSVGKASAIQYPSSNGGPPTFNATFNDLKVSIRNENMPLLDSVTLNILLPKMFYFCPDKDSYSYSFKKLDLKKGESTTVSIADIKLYSYIYPNSGKMDFCIWATLPNAAIDSVVSNNRSCTTIAVTLTVATENLSDEKVQLYPNPVGDVLHLQSSFDIGYATKLLICNNLGQKTTILQLDNTTEQTFNISALNQGLYWYKLQNEQGVIVKQGTFLKI